MSLTSVQHGGLGYVDGVVPVLVRESGQSLLEVFFVIWFILVPILVAVESVVMRVDMFLKVIQVAKHSLVIIKIIH